MTDLNPAPRLWVSRSRGTAIDLEHVAAVIRDGDWYKVIVTGAKEPLFVDSDSGKSLIKAFVDYRSIKIPEFR